MPKASEGAVVREEGKKEEGLHMYDMRRGVKRTALQKAHYACRQSYLLQGNITGVRRPEGLDAREWRKNIGYYDIPPDAPYTIRKVSDETGLGVYAARLIKKGTVVEGLKGLRGRPVPKRYMTGTSIITLDVLKPNPSKSPYKEDLFVDAEVSYYLRGSLSFLNHACKVHANCDPHVAKFNPFERIKTKRDVQPGEELFIWYGPHEHWKGMCEFCKPIKRKK